MKKNAGLGLVSTDTEGIILSFNQAAEKMLGYTAKELVGKQSPAIFHDIDQVVQRSSEFSKALKQDITPGFHTFICHSDLGFENKFQWTYIHKNGTKFPVKLSIATLYNDSGTKTGYLGIAEDVSDSITKEQVLILSNKRLNEANEELTQFAYRTSHDLKAPLISSKCLMRFILEDIESNQLQEASKSTQKALDQMQKLETLINDILNLVKADFNLESRVTVDIKNMMEDIKVNLSYLASDNMCDVINDISDIKPYTQKMRIRQILENLISNSIKYVDNTKKSSFVRISDQVSNGDYILIVEDNGVGIPEKSQNKVFDAFKRFHPKLSFGSGIGMSIVKKHVAAINWKISFTSSGKGTKFIVKICGALGEK